MPHRVGMGWLTPQPASFPLYTLPPSLSRPQGKPSSSGHKPLATLHFRLSHPPSKNRPLMDRKYRLCDPSPAPDLSTLCHRPRPLHFLVKRPCLMRLHIGANLASSQKCLYSEADPASQPQHPHSSPQAAKLPSWPRHTESGWGTWELKAHTPHPESKNAWPIPPR